jgi:hypothetical protein
VRRLDQNEAGGIKSEAVEAMSKKTAEMAAVLASLNWNDEDERARRLQTSQYRHYKTEGSGDGAFGGRHNFMKAAAVETAFRQVSIKGGNTKG